MTEIVTGEIKFIEERKPGGMAELNYYSVDLEPIVRREISSALRLVASDKHSDLANQFRAVADSLSPATEAAKLNPCGGCGEPAMLTGRGYNCPAYCRGRFQPTFEKWNFANPIPFQGDHADCALKYGIGAKFSNKNFPEIYAVTKSHFKGIVRMQKEDGGGWSLNVTEDKLPATKNVLFRDPENWRVVE